MYATYKYIDINIGERKREKKKQRERESIYVSIGYVKAFLSLCKETKVNLLLPGLPGHPQIGRWL